MASKLTEKLKNSPGDVIVVGAGLAGSECAWQLAKKGHSVTLVEQRGTRTTEAHTSDQFAELVCSNSLKSLETDSAPGLLKDELGKLSSLILEAAHQSRVPAGQALAVDRQQFSSHITQKLSRHPKITVLREPVDHFEQLVVPGPKGIRPVVIATGPLTSVDFAESLKQLTGEQLYFYDAIAPIIDGTTINKSIAWTGNRYDKGKTDDNEGDYLNCPLSLEEYETFIDALAAGEQIAPHDFEKAIYFQGCQPIEALLERGRKTLAFGPMKPKGLIDPRTGKEPYAAVQLRKEDSEGRSWNIVGFQTKLKYPEQQRIFRLIPGLENAQFFRLGSMHRNTFINSPVLLDSNFRLKKFPVISFAGQITGVEGYLESAAIGALVGRLLGLRLSGYEHGAPPPATTALGALAHNIFNGKAKNFQPMNMNWGLVPLNEINERDQEKKSKLVSRARRNFNHWLALFGEDSQVQSNP